MRHFLAGISSNMYRKIFHDPFFRFFHTIRFLPWKRTCLSFARHDAVEICGFDCDMCTLKVKGGLNWNLSPDGSQLALNLEPLGHRVTFMAVRDKTTHEVEVNQWPLTNIDWAPDGKSVLVSTRTATGARPILGVEPNGNYRVLLEGDNATQLWWAIESPDGRYAALEVVTGANNVWMVENF